MSTRISTVSTAVRLRKASLTCRTALSILLVIRLLRLTDSIGLMLRCNRNSGTHRFPSRDPSAN
jgi:hypothetical protein